MRQRKRLREENDEKENYTVVSDQVDRALEASTILGSIDRNLKFSIMKPLQVKWIMEVPNLL